MFTEYIRFQVVGVLVLATIAIVYKKSKRLPLLSTRWFSILLLSVCANLTFDMITVYTITHMDTVDPFVNRLCHQFFIGTLDLAIMCLYFYIDHLGNQEERRTPMQLFGRMVPFLLSILVIIFGDLNYVCDENGVYSYGNMANTIYICCALYVFAAVLTTNKHKRFISRQRVVSIYAGLAVWALAGIIQYFVKTLLISGVSLCLLILIIYLSFENPREYLNAPTNSFNNLAYQKMLAQAFGRKKLFYVINISVEDYATIHRMFGQETADQMLAAISTYIQQTFHVRVYNHSGDDLIVIADNAEDSHEMIIEQVSMLEKRFEGTWNFGSSSYHLDGRITIVECPKYAKDEKELHDVLHFMLTQKRIGTMGVQTVNQFILEQRQRHNCIADLVQQAILKDEITMFYQPIYSVKEKAFVSAEALVRLSNTGELGFVSPEEFIPIAENMGLIMELGARIFDKVCRFIARGGLAKLGVHYIEVNLSAIQCMDSDLPGQLASVMKQYNIPPEFINLEITETAAIESGELLAKNMKRLKDMGCSFSMDDFGTGFSNLSKMAEVNYDLIKLDKSLIWPCFEKNGDKANVILNNVIAMINRLDVRIVAEGVETQEQVERLTNLKVDYLQGYYYSKPVSELKYLEFLESHR